ncbi:MAG TPA: dihydrolipoyl dehydrogenase [Candidatus Egerieousia sp.]|nr:dihydrolipoyl dehydrogenase [Candidatus Egerieousia sp.]
MNFDFDILVIGSGPGGYVAAVKAAQYGFKTAVVERAEIGGICLNWGCIPTKALLKSAEAFEILKHPEAYGIVADGFNVSFDVQKIVERERGVSDKMRRGVEFLFKKYNVSVIAGTAKFLDANTVTVTVDAASNESGSVAAAENTITAKYIIVATGARPKALPFAPFDGEKIISYKDALVPKTLPKSLAVIGSGAIGSELANFYLSMGTQVYLIEFLDKIVPLEDDDISGQLSRSFRKNGMKVMTSAKVTGVKFNKLQDESGAERDNCELTVETKKGVETINVERVLCAVGVAPNTDNMGLEEIGVKMERGKIAVNEFYNACGDVYAIGDVIATPALAHVASAEAVACVAHIAELEGKPGAKFHPIDYKHIPGATYTSPQIASAGLTEQKAKEFGIEYKVGKFMFTASGKATAAGKTDGFVKLISDAKSDKLIGVHLIGADVTEIIGGMVLAMNLGATAEQVANTVFPHPTMSEGIKDAAEAMEL